MPPDNLQRAAQMRAEAYKKLDPEADWADQFLRPETQVERVGGVVSKQWGGVLAPMQKYERAMLREILDHRPGTYSPTALTEGIGQVAYLLEQGVDPFRAKAWLQMPDFGPDLVDWFHLVGPPHRDDQPSLGNLFLDPYWLLSLVRQILLALEPFHRAGFVHCDLKAKNICIRNELQQSTSTDRAGVIELAELAVIDVGCALRPPRRRERDPCRREIPYSERPDGVRQHFYIGANMAQDYIWPTLLGIQDGGEATVEGLRRRLKDGKPWFQAGATYAARVGQPEVLRRQAGFDMKQMQWRRRLDMANQVAGAAYISDHYYWAAALFDLGILEPLEALDWRIDFHGLACLVQAFLSLGRGLFEGANGMEPSTRVFHGAGDADGQRADAFLRALPKRLHGYDTWPMQAAGEMPHKVLAQEIDLLIPVERRQIEMKRRYLAPAGISDERCLPVWSVALDPHYILGGSVEESAQGQQWARDEARWTAVTVLGTKLAVASFVEEAETPEWRIVGETRLAGLNWLDGMVAVRGALESLRALPWGEAQAAAQGRLAGALACAAEVGRWVDGVAGGAAGGELALHGLDAVLAREAVGLKAAADAMQAALEQGAWAEADLEEALPDAAAWHVGIEASRAVVRNKLRAEALRRQLQAHLAAAQVIEARLEGAFEVPLQEATKMVLEAAEGRDGWEDLDSAVLTQELLALDAGAAGLVQELERARQALRLAGKRGLQSVNVARKAWDDEGTALPGVARWDADIRQEWERRRLAALPPPAPVPAPSPVPAPAPVAGLPSLRKPLRWNGRLLAALALLGVTVGAAVWWPRPPAVQREPASQPNLPPSAPQAFVTASAGKPPPTAPDLWPVGKEFRDELSGGSKGPAMVVLPDGSYWQGAAAGEVGAEEDEKPQRQVRIDYRLAVGKYPVTFDEWQQCVDGGGCKRNSKPADRGWDRGKRPVINVGHNDAMEYIAWLNGQLGDKTKPYRLLSEKEWEYAARGEQAGQKESKPFARLKLADERFSSGDCLDTDQANYDGRIDYNNCGAKTGNYRAKTVEVGSLKGENQFGLFDMQGNVWQWTADCYYGSYANPAVPEAANQKNGGAAMKCDEYDLRSMRGGSFNNDPLHLRAANRSKLTPANRNFYVGFRIARTLPQSGS